MQNFKQPNKHLIKQPIKQPRGSVSGFHTHHCGMYAQEIVPVWVDLKKNRHDNET